MVFDLSKVPETQRNELSDIAIAMTKSLFEQPGEEERYQEWLKERRANEAKKKPQQ